MSETAGNTRPAAAADRSAGELIKEVTTLVPRLVRDEIKLAQVEMTSKGKQMGIGAGALSPLSPRGPPRPGPAPPPPGSSPSTLLAACWLARSSP